MGASTGGFTDCLLQAGARKVYAVDVGYGQLAWKLRDDPRVVIIERTNIRHFDGVGIAEPVDIAAIDTSFISLRLVIPPVLRFVKEGGIILALVKPQFEVGKGEVGKKGVVRDPALHLRVVAELAAFCGTGPVRPGDLRVAAHGPGGEQGILHLGVKKRRKIG